MNNLLLLNDWGIKKFLTLIFSIQLALWAVLCLDFLGIQIPLLRQIIGFIYLSFIPGILLVRILKIHKINGIEVLSISVGLSLTTLMFTGLIINTIFPPLGILRPISIIPLISSLSAIVLFLCMLCYKIDNAFDDPGSYDIKNALSLPVLFLCIIPFMAIFGTYLMNLYNNNILIVLLLAAISLIVILICFDIIPINFYPLAVFIISISLLYHKSLISMYLVELGDTSFEYWTVRSLVMNSIWNPAEFGNLNAMLSLVFLLPIYSIVLAEDIWLFKIIFPLLFSLVPLALYQVYQKQTNAKIAFLSCFFFVSVFSFYGTLLGAIRQQLAELFLVLLILIIINKNIKKIKRSILFICFSVSLIVSHYGLTYIYMLSFIIALSILAFYESPIKMKLADLFQINSTKETSDKELCPIFSNFSSRMINSNLLFIFIICSLIWYINISGSSAFNIAVNIGNHISNSIFLDFLNPESTQGLDIILRPSETLVGKFNKAIHIIMQLFIAVGITVSVLRYNKRNFNYEYLAFSIPFFGICLACLLIPYFASTLNTSRLYHIALIFMAPFCVVGGISIFKIFGRCSDYAWQNGSIRYPLRVLPILFAIFFMMNSGIIHELANQPVSFSLNSSVFIAPHFNEKEIISAEWLSNNMNYGIKAYADAHNAYLLQMMIGSFLPIYFFNDSYDKITKIDSDSYTFLGKENTIFRNIILDNFKKPRQDCRQVPLQNLTLNYILPKMSKLYNNGDSAVLYYSPYGVVSPN